ncbi:MAG: hypothetical protein ACJ76H_17200 [Bacteriovoracaceae bacterium]
MKLILIFFITTILSSHALETDNYLVWGMTLPDSGDDISQFFRKQIEEVLDSSQDEDLSCQDVTFRISKKFRTAGKTRKLYENWSVNSLHGKIFPETSFYLAESIYRNTWRAFYLNKSGLSPNVQVNDIYFGVDKISHFASTGRRYLETYLGKIKKGYSPAEAEKATIRFGLRNEYTILGLWPTGVFSYADMEANYQGFRFYKKLCLDGEHTYLKKVDRSWKLVKSPDIREFATPYWDESFNISYRLKGMWAIASEVIQNKYCPMKNGPDVQARMKYYQDIAVKSPSIKYIEELQARGYFMAPVPAKTQSVDELCADI